MLQRCETLLQSQVKFALCHAHPQAGGRGIAWLPQSLVTDDLANGQLAAAGGDAWQVALDIRLYRTPASLGTAAQAFWQAARVSSPIGR